jgi:MYXO-CTERM domain-containing protein
MTRTLSVCLAFALAALSAPRAFAFCVEQPTNPNGGNFTKVAWAVPVTFKIHDTGSATGPVSTVDKTAEFAAVRAAFAQWAAADCTNLAFTDGGTVPSNEVVNLQQTAPEIRVYWARDTTEWGSSTTTAIAKTWFNYDATGKIVSAAILLNAIDKMWSTTVETDKYDVQSVVATEVGRVIGLKASTDTSAVMYPQFVLGSIDKRTLTADDVAGVGYLYPGTATDAGACGTGTPDTACASPTQQDGGTTTQEDGGTTTQQDSGTATQQDGGSGQDASTQYCDQGSDCPSGVCDVNHQCVPPSDDGGCGCRVGAAADGGYLALSLLLLGLALGLTARRRR